MYKLKDALFELEKNNIIKVKLIEAKVLAVWGEVVGGAVRENTRPQRFNSGILFVKTKSPSWAQELKALNSNIKKKINEVLGTEILKDIRFNHDSGFFKSAAAIEEVKNKKESISVTTVALTEDELDFIENIASNIKEDGLRDQLINIAVKSKKLSKLRPRKK